MNLWTRIKKVFRSEERTAHFKSGVIKFFNRSKGYGFIESPETTKEVFVHITELEDRVHKGDAVRFELDLNSILAKKA
ncbi:MAG: cold shock domain-containing protein [Bacteroidota bacterium]